MPTRPLREPTYFILTALAREPSHGYRLMSAIDELSGGRVKVRAGTLYGALDRLQRDGLIERAGTETADGPPRHRYALTRLGRDVLAADIERLQANVAVGLSSIGGSA